MSFLGGPECSTAANPLAQFQKQTAADTSLQRDRLRAGIQPLNAFRSQQGRPEDAQAFQDFQHQGPQLGEQLPNEAFHLEQLRREQEHLERTGGGGGWAGEFAQQPLPPNFAPEAFAQQQQASRDGAFSPQDFAQFRQSQLSPVQRNQSPSSFQQQSAYPRPAMYGTAMGGIMQRPMFQSQMYGQQPQQQQQEQYQGKGKGRIQELSDTDWERQFEELSTEDKEGVDMEALDREAERAVEEELNGVDR